MFQRFVIGVERGLPLPGCLGRPTPEKGFFGCFFHVGPPAQESYAYGSSVTAQDLIALFEGRGTQPGFFRESARGARVGIRTCWSSCRRGLLNSALGCVFPPAKPERAHTNDGSFGAMTTMPIPTKIACPTMAGTLAHPVGTASTSPGGGFLVAASSESTRVSIWSADGQHREEDLGCAFDCTSASIDGRGKLVAFIGPKTGQLGVFDLSERRWVGVEQESGSVAGAFDEQSRLWVVRATREGFVAELRAAETAELLASTSFGSSYFAAGGAWLQPGPRPNTALVETYSGQSEQEYYLCSFGPGGRMLAKHLPILDGDQHVFLSERARFVVSLDHEDPAVIRYTLAFEGGSTRLPWPDYDELKCEDERPGYQCAFLDETHALVSSSEGRLFVLDVASMAFASEIHVDGHAPVPMSIKYPTLAEPGLVSDLVAFGRCGAFVVALFAEGARAPAPSYVLLPVAALLGS